MVGLVRSGLCGTDGAFGVVGGEVVLSSPSVRILCVVWAVSGVVVLVIFAVIKV